jgi:hypothetical protein
MLMLCEQSCLQTEQTKDAEEQAQGVDGHDFLVLVQLGSAEKVHRR